MSLDLLARFAYPTVLGKDNQELENFFYEVGMGTKEKDSQIIQEIEKFPIIMKYLTLIANSAGLKPFDSQVIQAYIIGNELLNNTTDPSSIETYINDKIQREAGFKSENYFHHNLHVNKVGFMQPIAPTEQEKRDCRVIPGTVADTYNKIILYPMIRTDDRKFVMVENPFQLHTSPYVAVHKNIIIETLESDQKDNLINYGFRFQK